MSQKNNGSRKILKILLIPLKLIYSLLKAVLKTIFLDLFRNIKKETIYAFNKEEKMRIKQELETKKFIDNHFTEDLSISDISNALKISHPVMTRLFKKSFSLSPLEYRNKLRIFEAQKLFLITPCKIDKTRRATGFKDQTSFYRNFKQNTLVSPKVFSQS